MALCRKYERMLLLFATTFSGQEYKLTFIVDGIDDMHRNGRKAAMPLRPLHMDADVAVLITRREATANMVALNVLLCWYNLPLC